MSRPLDAATFREVKLGALAALGGFLFLNTSLGYVILSYVGTALGVTVVGPGALSALHGPFRLGFGDASHVGWWIIAGRGTAERAAGLLIPPAARVPVSAPVTLSSVSRSPPGRP